MPEMSLLKKPLAIENPGSAEKGLQRLSVNSMTEWVFLQKKMICK